LRTTIVIDDELMAKAIELTGLPTKRAVVEASLKLIIQVKRQKGIRRLKGKVKWETHPIDRVRDLLGSIESGVPDLGSHHREHLPSSIASSAEKSKNSGRGRGSPPS
jgi:Arc/MetJ family transcription regulator